MPSPVPLLTADNFHTWRIQMSAFLATKHLLPFVTGSITFTTFLSITTGAARRHRKSRWRQLRARATGMILLHIGEDLILDFAGIRNPIRLWVAIKQNYAGRLPNVGDLVSRFENTRLVEEGTVEGYVAKMRRIYMDLEMACDDDETMEDYSLPVEVECGIPKEWKVHTAKLWELLDEKEAMGHGRLTVVFGHLLRLQDAERRARGIKDGQPLFVNGRYAAEVRL